MHSRLNPPGEQVNWPDQVLCRHQLLQHIRLYIPRSGATRIGSVGEVSQLTPGHKEARSNVDAQVTKEPVDRELRRRQLAQRLVAHQARTQTIFTLTGLSKHQLATLRQRWRVTQEMRRRGPSPRSFAVFWSTLRLRSEAAALAVFWRILGRAGDVNAKNAAIDFGERLCDVFETYLACFPKSELELEHLALLARGLDQGDAIAISNCTNCEAVILSDLLGTRRHLCSHCQQSADGAAATSSESDGSSNDQPGSVDRADEAVQQELF